jgi:hypothetical protein
LIDGFEPKLPGEAFTIVTAGSVGGEFSDIVGQPSDDVLGLFWTLQYTPTSAILTTAALPGDINLDGGVDRIDAALFATRFGSSSRSNWSTGDFDNDGQTSLVDWGILQSHLGRPRAPSPSAAAVPEPASWTIALVVGILMASASRRRNRSTRRTF